MTENDLQELIGSWENLLITIDFISEHPEHFDALMNISMNDHLKDSWRACWLVNKINDRYPGKFEPYIERVTDFVRQTNDSSKKREFLRLISLYQISDEKAGPMLDFCISQFTSNSEPVAVRVHSMQILFNISEREPDFKPELIQLIEHEIEYHSSAGIVSRGRKLLHKLYKQNSWKQWLMGILKYMGA